MLSKYYPPDFDPSAIKRTKGPKNAGPKQITVRLMAPFSMQCTACGEFIHKGRKFNARKETAEEKYLSIAIYRFYIRCTRCSAEIVFLTDPRNMDYRCERGAKRNFEPWRPEKEEITDEQHLDELAAMEAEVEEDTMKGLEERAQEASTEMAVADALDNIRSRNARREAEAREEKEVTVKEMVDWKKKRAEEEDEEVARLAFQSATGERIKRLVPEEDGEEGVGSTDDFHWKNGRAEGGGDVPDFTFKRSKAKKDFAAALGVKKSVTTKVSPAPVVKAAPAVMVKQPVLLAGYGSDSD